MITYAIFACNTNHITAQKRLSWDMNKNLVYIWASTGKQDVQNQRHKILEYGNRQGGRIESLRRSRFLVAQ